MASALSLRSRTKPSSHWSGVAALNDATPAEIHAVSAATKTIYVTKITLTITAHADAKHVNVQDDNDTPKVIAHQEDHTEAAGVPSNVTWDFGRDGIPLTAGKNLDCVSEASGVAGYVYAEGYEVTT